MMTNNRIRKTASRRFVPSLAILEGRALPSTFTVLNIADSGAGSLRQAIADAKANPGHDAISFAEGLEGTITLTGRQLNISSDLAINGPGADKLTVSGDHLSRVFNVVGGADASSAIIVSISGLAIKDGRGTIA